MLVPVSFVYQGRVVRSVILDDGIYFVFCDLCRIRGFRTAAERTLHTPVYQRIRTAIGSTVVRLISRDSVLAVLSSMRHIEKCSDGEYELYKWLMGEVLPELYKRSDCKRFIPVAPWANPKVKERAAAKTSVLHTEPDTVKEQTEIVKLFESAVDRPFILICFPKNHPENNKENTEK